MEKIDLVSLLNEVIDWFGKNEDYPIPAIVWSKVNMVSRFGEYQHWKNLIIISNMLQTDEISKKAIKYVIYHEYTHQLYGEHNDQFNERMKKFPDADECLLDLNNYFESFTERNEYMEVQQELQLRDSEETVFCKLPFDDKNEDSYWDHLQYVNHYITGLLPGKIPEKFCNRRIKQVIWVIEFPKYCSIVGWSKDVMFFHSVQTINFTKVGGARIDYQFKYRQNKGAMILPYSTFIGLYEKEIPKDLRDNGICFSDVIDKNVMIDVIGSINNFSYDLLEYGIADRIIDNVEDVEITKVDELFALAEKTDTRIKRVTILNKAVEIEKSYRTFLRRALAFKDCWIYDRALMDFATALQFPEDDKEKMNIIKIRKEIEQLKDVITLL